MSINPPVPFPPSTAFPHTAVNDPSTSANDPAKSGPSEGNGAVSASDSATRPASSAARVTSPETSVGGTLLSWLIIAGVAAAGWHFQDKWLPWLDPILARSKPPAAKPPRIVPVSTTVVRKRDLPLYLTGLGTVTAFKTVTLRARVEGELKSVTFSEGELVDEGKLLAEIDSRAFDVQFAQAEGLLARDQAILKSAKATLSRYEGLLASKSISAQEYDDQALIVQQTMASIQTNEATVANANLQLTYCRIIAPISGRIGLRLVDQGNIVRANDPSGLAVITQLQPIALLFTIPQDEISRVQQRANQDEPLQVEAFDRDFKRKLASGKLLAIDNQVDATTGTVRIKAQFDNEDGLLFPNQFVNARLLVATRRDAVVVPSAAVQRGPVSMFVYVVKRGEKESTVELRKVVTGPSEGTETSIESGLEPGEIVVTDGLDKLQDGAKVSPRDKDAPKDSGQEGKRGGKPTDGENPRRPSAPSTAPSTEADVPASQSKSAAADPHPSGASEKQHGTVAEQKRADPDVAPKSESDSKSDDSGAKPLLEPAAKPVDESRRRDTP